MLHFYTVINYQKEFKKTTDEKELYTENYRTLLKLIEENQPKTNKCVLVFQAGENVNVGEGCRAVITA